MKRSNPILTSVALAGLLMAPLACGDDVPSAAAPPAGGNAAAGTAILTGGSEAALGDGAFGAAPAEEAAPPPDAAPPSPTGDATGAGDASEIAYAYSPIGKRDPFRSLFDQLQKEEVGQQLTELQRFEIDQLRLVAIVSRIATPYAMVEDPNGKGHTLTRGTLIGKNWGRVAQITPDCVVVKEEYRDYTGRKVTNRTPMCLPPAGELTVD